MKIVKVMLFCAVMGAGAMRVVWPDTAHAVAETPSANPYATVQDVPLILLQQMRRDMSREQFISQVLGTLRNYGEERNILHKGVVEKVEQEAHVQAKRRFFTSMLLYDLNFDGNVTREELEEHFANMEKKRGRGIANDAMQLQKLMEADADGDGVITLKEMSDPPKASDNKKVSTLAELLALDPDKDGVLMGAELTALAEKAFDLIDVDRNTLLSTEEWSAIRQDMETKNILKQLSDKAQQGICHLPKAAEGEEIMLLAAHQGEVSSVGFGSESSQVTYTNTVAFAPGLSQKQYLVLLSSQPMVWQLKDAPAALSRVVVVGPVERGGKTVQAGALGVAAEKVSFVPLECLPKAAEELTHASGQLEVTRVHLKTYLSREPVTVKKIQRYEQAEIGAGKVQVQTISVKTVALMPGFDPQIWRDHIERGRERLRIFDHDEVARIISPAKAVSYPVYPMAFGLAQLVHQGVLEPVENGAMMTIVLDSHEREMTRIIGVEKVVLTQDIQPGENPDRKSREGARVIKGYDYKIVKPLVAYPQNVPFFLAGKFILTKSGALPEGRAPFCIIEEETGKPIGMSACR